MISRFSSYLSALYDKTAVWWAFVNLGMAFFLSYMTLKIPAAICYATALYFAVWYWLFGDQDV